MNSCVDYIRIEFALNCMASASDQYMNTCFMSSTAVY